MNGLNRGIRHLINEIEYESIGVELGVWRGDSSHYFIKRAKKMHLVDSWSLESYKHLDTWENYLERNKNLIKIKGKVKEKHIKSFQEYYDKIYKKVVNRFKYEDKIFIHRMDTNKFFKTFNEKVDWFYVDAAHDEEGCYKDLVNSYKHLKKFGGGIIYGDDYGLKGGVTRAVDKFKNEYDLNYKIKMLPHNQFQVKI